MPIVNLLSYTNIQEGANVTHIVGKLDHVLQKVADHRQEVMINTLAVSPQPNGKPVPQRQRSSVDASAGGHSSGASGYSPGASGHSPEVTVTRRAPLKERIERLRVSVSEQGDQMYGSLNREKRPKSSSIVELREHPNPETRPRQTSAL